MNRMHRLNKVSGTLDHPPPESPATQIPQCSSSQTLITCEPTAEETTLRFGTLAVRLPGTLLYRVPGTLIGDDRSPGTLNHTSDDEMQFCK